MNGLTRKQKELEAEAQKRAEMLGKLDTSDLERLRQKIEQTTNQTKEAREGVLGLLDAWDTLSDSDKASAIADECFMIADGLSLAAETAEMFEGTLGSTLSTVSDLVAGVGDIAAGTAMCPFGRPDRWCYRYPFRRDRHYRFVQKTDRGKQAYPCRIPAGPLGN